MGEETPSDVLETEEAAESGSVVDTPVHMITGEDITDGSIKLHPNTGPFGENDFIRLGDGIHDGLQIGHDLDIGDNPDIAYDIALGTGAGGLEAGFNIAAQGENSFSNLGLGLRSDEFNNPLGNDGFGLDDGGMASFAEDHQFLGLEYERISLFHDGKLTIDGSAGLDISDDKGLIGRVGAQYEKMYDNGWQSTTGIEASYDGDLGVVAAAELQKQTTIGDLPAEFTIAGLVGYDDHELLARAEAALALQVTDKVTVDGVAYAQKHGDETTVGGRVGVYREIIEGALSAGIQAGIEQRDGGDMDKSVGIGFRIPIGP